MLTLWTKNRLHLNTNTTVCSYMFILNISSVAKKTTTVRWMKNDWSVQSLEGRDGTWRHAPLWQQHILRSTRTALLARPDMPAGQLIHEIITNHTEKRSSFKSFVVCCTLFICGFLLCDIDIAGCACDLRVKLWVASQCNTVACGSILHMFIDYALACDKIVN